MPERDAGSEGTDSRGINQLACVCGGNDWIRSDAYGKPYENGYALCGHCARPNTERGQRRDANQLAADVRKALITLNVATDWQRRHRKVGIASLDELVALVVSLSGETLSLKEKVGTLQQERDTLENRWLDDNARAVAAEARCARLQQEADRQLARHLCYTSAPSRERFWRAVDEALAGPDTPAEEEA